MHANDFSLEIDPRFVSLLMQTTPPGRGGSGRVERVSYDPANVKNAQNGHFEISRVISCNIILKATQKTFKYYFTIFFFYHSLPSLATVLI